MSKFTATKYGSKKDALHAGLVEAEARCGRWLADGNAAAERGNKYRAEQCYEKSQFWLDRANKIRDLLVSL